MRAGQRDLFTKRVRRAPPALERGLHIAIADVLRRWAGPDWQWTHIASGEYRTPATAALLKRLGVVPGWPDLILISPDRIPHFLEFKRKGGRLTSDQAHFAAWCQACGVPFEVRDSFDGALDVLQGWGVLRVRVKIAA